MRGLDSAIVSNKRVLLRLDADVKIAYSQSDREYLVVDDFRLKSALETINYLRNQQAILILLGHLGRPKGSDANFSLKPVYLHLSALLKTPIKFSPNIFSPLNVQTIDNLKAGSIIALENLRFDPGENNNSRTFARKLAEYGEIYVNESFATAHRELASTSAITEFLPSYAGFAFEREIEVIKNLMKAPVKPYCAVIGGAKITEKLPVLRFLLKHADWILVGGAIANTFLAAKGVDVRRSLVDNTQYNMAKKIWQLSRGRIILPDDYIWQSERIVDIGPKTIKKFQQYINRSNTIFFNGTMGIFEERSGMEGSAAIATAIAKTDGTTIAGGGDTIACIRQLKLDREFSFISTGGGATLSLLAGQRLPALEALNSRH